MKINENAVKILEKRYIPKDKDGKLLETPETMFRRIANAIAKNEIEADPKKGALWADAFYDVMTSMRFLPNSPTIMNAGRPLGQLSACFVLPIEDNMESIFDGVKNAAIIHKSGGGTGFSFSRLRPSMSVVGSTGGVASGPVSFMRVFNMATEVVKQGGTRRGANMGILRVDHPDILNFINCKAVNTEITNFNLSIGLTEEFMQKVKSGENYNLIDPATKQITASLNAKEVFETIVAAAWKNGEPGIIFLDRINADNPVPSQGTIEATNPCFTGDTLVATVKHGFVPIKDLVGTRPQVYSVNFDTNTLEVREMCDIRKTQEQATLVRVLLQVNGELEAIDCTPDHVFYAAGRAILAKHLKVGTKLSAMLMGNRSDKLVTVCGVDELPNKEDVFDGSVPGNHNFYVASGKSSSSGAKIGVLVHNCGEQPLLPYEACNLGSINLAEMVDATNNIDYDLLARTISTAVRFLDNVIEVNNYPLPKISEVTRSTRKIGLGVMGFADMLIKLNVRYGSDEAVQLAEEVMEFIDSQGHLASQNLAAERGAFPLFNESVYADGPALRNATITTIAPTGTLSIIANCSSGVEPIFAFAFKRNQADMDMIDINSALQQRLESKNLLTKDVKERLLKEGTIAHIKEIPEEIRNVFVCAHDIAPIDHIKMQAAFQRHIDNAVSKTINFPNSATRNDVFSAYMLAYEEGCKGITIYRDGSRDSQVLSLGVNTGEKVVNEAPIVTPISPGSSSMVLPGTEFYGKLLPRPRPGMVAGFTEKIAIGCGSLYVTVNYDEHGICEVFTSTGKNGGCPSQSTATSRLVSVALRSGMDIKEIYSQLKGIRCPSTQKRDGAKCSSCPDAIAQVLGKVNQYFINQGTGSAPLEAVIDEKSACQECGALAAHEGGCITCYSCGHSKCG